jgi:hypothetical protein
MRQRIRCGGSLQEQCRDGRVFLTFREWKGSEGVSVALLLQQFKAVSLLPSGAVFYGLGC